MTRGGVAGDGPRLDGPPLDGEALRHIRARLADDQEQAPAWRDGLSAATRRALGELGRSTVELVGRGAAPDVEGAALAQDAHRIGRSFGRLLREAGLGISGAMAAFSYFRASVAEAVTTHAQAQGMGADAAGGVWERVSRLEDEILVAFTAEYEREGEGTPLADRAGNR